jgi:hypothetical protein
MSTLLVRQLATANGAWDARRGQGAQDFLSDLDAVAQIIASTILLLRGEWYENFALGTPLFQAILGVPNTSAGVALILRQRILSVPYVTGVLDIDVNYIGKSRAYSFSATVQTQFGTLQVNLPLPGIQAAV